MQVGITLAVSMAHHINRDAVHKNGKVRAVVGVKTAKENLIRFAAAMMLAENQARRESQDVARSIGRAELEVFGPTGLFRGGGCRLLAPDVDLYGLRRFSASGAIHAR
jgi:hypothetical protein